MDSKQENIPKSILRTYFDKINEFEEGKGNSSPNNNSTPKKSASITEKSSQGDICFSKSANSVNSQSDFSLEQKNNLKISTFQTYPSIALPSITIPSNFSYLEEENRALKEQLKLTKELEENEINEMKKFVNNLKSQLDFIDKSMLKSYRENQKSLEKENRKLKRELELLKEEQQKVGKEEQEILPYYRKLVNELKAQTVSLQEHIISLNSEKQKTVDEINQMKKKNRELTSKNEKLNLMLREIEESRKSDLKELELDKLRLKQEIQDSRLNKSSDNRPETASLKSQISKLENIIVSQKEIIRQLKRELIQQRQDFYSHLQTSLELLSCSESEFDLYSPINNSPSSQSIRPSPKNGIKTNFSPSLQLDEKTQNFSSPTSNQFEFSSINSKQAFQKKSPFQNMQHNYFPNPDLKDTISTHKLFPSQNNTPNKPTDPSDMQLDLLEIEKEIQKLQKSLLQASKNLSINIE